MAEASTPRVEAIATTQDKHPLAVRSIRGTMSDTKQDHRTTVQKLTVPQANKYVRSRDHNFNGRREHFLRDSLEEI